MLYTTSHAYLSYHGTPLYFSLPLPLTSGNLKYDLFFPVSLFDHLIESMLTCNTMLVPSSQHGDLTFLYNAK